MGGPWTIAYHNRTSHDIHIAPVDTHMFDWTPFNIVHAPKPVLATGEQDSLEIELTGPEIYPGIWWSQVAWTLNNLYLYIRINLNVTSADTFNWVVAPYGASSAPTTWGPDYTSESSTANIKGAGGNETVTFSPTNHGSSLLIKATFENAD